MNLKSVSLRMLLPALMVVLVVACEQPSTQNPSPTAAPKQAASASWSSKEAAAHIGERATVCGPVVDTLYATNINGEPTFLNFDRAYPNHTFVVLIWGSDRGAFPSNPQTYYKGKEICATGLVEGSQGKPEITARDGNQLEIQR